MSEKDKIAFRGKTEKEILEFLTLEGQLIVELDGFSTRTKRTMLGNLREIARLPEWIQSILLDDINTAVTNRIQTMKMIIKNYETTEPFSNRRTMSDVACEREKET